MKAKRFGKVLPVRLSQSVNDRLILVAEAAGISKSDALRMAVAHGLPDLEQGRMVLQVKAKEVAK